MTKHLHWSGYLFSFEEQLFGRAQMARCASLDGIPRDLNGWLIHIYKPGVVIPGTEELVHEPPFEYDLAFRWGRGRLLLLGNSHRVARHFVHNEMRQVAAGVLKKCELKIHSFVTGMMDYREPPSILPLERRRERMPNDPERRQEELDHLIDRLCGTVAVPEIKARLMQNVSDVGLLVSYLRRIVLTNRQFNGDENGARGLASAVGIEQRWETFRSIYVLSSVHARTDAFGENLNVMSFQGDSVEKAQVVQDNAEIVKFYACSIRRSGTEVIRLGRDGFVSFQLPSEQESALVRLGELDRIIRFLTDVGLVM